MQKLIISIGILFFTSFLFSQSPGVDSLTCWSSHFLDKNASNQLKETENKKFIDAFTIELSNKASFENAYTHLKSISVQISPDKTFRVFTWFVLLKNGYKCYGLVQTTAKKIKQPVVTFLNDQGEDLKAAEFKTLNAKTWFGSLYYNMVPFKIKGKKYYVLLGFNPGNGLSHKKVVEVLQIMPNGQPRFGSPIFEKDKKIANRIILEYDARAKITLRYNETLKMIVFDHLVPQRPELENQFQYYVPDLSYDAFELVKNSWTYKPDIDARNLTDELGKEGTRLVIDGVNDKNTLEKKNEDDNKKEEK